MRESQSINEYGLKDSLQDAIELILHVSFVIALMAIISNDTVIKYMFKYWTVIILCLFIVVCLILNSKIKNIIQNFYITISARIAFVCTVFIAFN